MILLLAAWAALAQQPAESELPQMNVQTFRPSVDSAGTLWTDDAGLARDGEASVRFLLGYQRDPLVLHRDDAYQTVLQDVAQFDLMAGYTWKRLRLGGYLPVYGLTQGAGIEGGAGIGDVALDLRATLLTREEGPVGIAFAGRVGFPTATVQAPVASPDITYELSAIVDGQFGPLLLAANVGTRGMPTADLPNTTVGPAFVYRAGAGLALTDHVGLSLDLGGNATYAALDSGAGLPLEALVGGWGHLGAGWTLRGGVGRGLTRGVGAPNARAILAVGWSPGMPSQLDSDGDGIPDAVDACPHEPEDFDGWQDEDGCPDPTVVQFQVVDTDGQPVPGAEVALGEKRWSTEASPREVELNAGDYALSVAADGYLPLTASFRVPAGPPIEAHRVIELKPAEVGWLELTVSDLDNQPIDGQVRVGFRAPVPVEQGIALLELPAGRHVVSVSAEGYRPVRNPVEIVVDETEILDVELSPTQVTVTRDRVEITDRVYFETDKAVIRNVSFPLLDDVVAVLQDRVDILKVRVEGHTDSRGAPDYNLDLSRRRASSVRDYLITQGVAPERLVSEGYGMTRPLDDRETAEAWEKNRRVEFVILEWDE